MKASRDYCRDPFLCSLLGFKVRPSVRQDESSVHSLHKSFLSS